MNDFIQYGDKLEPIVSIDAIADCDVFRFNQQYDSLKILEQQKNKLKQELDDKQIMLNKKALEYESIPHYFFPCEVENEQKDVIGTTLNDVIVVYYDGVKALFGLPKNNTYILPDSYEGIDGYQIALPYFTTSEEVDLEIQGHHCSISKSSTQFVIMMNDNGVGEKKLELTATAYLKGTREVLATVQFYLSYMRKQMINYMMTSVPCTYCNYSRYNYSKIYATSFPIDIDVFCNGEHKQFHCDKGKETRIVEYPEITLFSSVIPMKNCASSKRFSWNEKGLSILSNEHSNNPIEFITKTTVNYEKSIVSLQSRQLTQFLSAFANLSLVIVSAPEHKRKEILHYLYGCMNDVILPSIKKAAQSVLNMISHRGSLLEWNAVINLVKAEANEDENEAGNATGETEKVYTMDQTEPIDTHESKEKVQMVNLSEEINNEVQSRVVTILKKNSVDMKERETDETEDDTPTHHTNENQEEFKSVNYKSFLRIMNDMKMDEIFESVYKRIATEKYVKPLNTSSTLTIVEFKEKGNGMTHPIVQSIVSAAVNIIQKLSHMNCMNKKPYTKINIIIDTNCSLRKNKLRMRTIVSCIFITVMRELGISFNLYVLCGRYKGVRIMLNNRSLLDIILLLFDLEEVVKMPSTPLDLLTIKGQFHEKDPVLIVGDGFSEQLMSSNEEVRTVFRVYLKLFLLCIKGTEDEALSISNQILLEKSLLANFQDNFILIEKVSDVSSLSIETLASLFYEKQELAMNTTLNVSTSEDGECDIHEDLNMEFKVDKSLTIIDKITKAKPVKMLEVTDNELLNYSNSSPTRSVILKTLNAQIQEENLFDAMNTSLFLPNKSTAHVASTSGSSILIAQYIKYIVNKTGDGKFFKKLGSGKIRSYNASVVIDCSSVAFSETNRAHSLITVFSILRNLSNMQLPCIDLWVASSQIIRIATGIPSLDLWENNIVSVLYHSLLSPCQNTCLPDCIRYACSTCNARSFQSVMMVLTNGVLCNDSRLEINSIVNECEMTYLGIGLGLYLCGFNNLLPTMIWNSNPTRLSETLLNLSEESMASDSSAIPEQPIDAMMLNANIERSNIETIRKICDIPSIYETTLSQIRFVDETDGQDAISKIDDINDSKYDLGVDGAFGHYSILFIILYLCRGEKTKTGKVIDEYITEEVLKKGKEVNGKRFSSVYKLGDYQVNGKPIGKGFKLQFAYDYKSAIRELESGKYRVTFITCSPGDGKMAKACDADVCDYADAFVSCVHDFFLKGGGVFWFLENYPYTYEADLYFKKFYGFEAVDSNHEYIEGGETMIRVKDEKPRASHFISIGGKATDFSKLSRLDYGILRIFEGRTLCAMNEKKLEEIGFCTFAMESEGNAAIMVRERKEEEKEGGRMIIDTAASKLFLEFTEEGTARWISNAAVWLCNSEQFEEERRIDPSLTSGIKIEKGVHNEKKPMIKRNLKTMKQMLFCLSIVMDTTGSMRFYINATRDNIEGILNSLKQVESSLHLEKGGIVGQVVQYKDYADKMTGETDEYITNNFSRLKKKLATFEAKGGHSGQCCDFKLCEDIQGGLIRALEQITKEEYRDYNHLILIVGDNPNHGETDYCELTQTLSGEYIDDLWFEIYEKIRLIHKIRVMFMPVNSDAILATMQRMQIFLGKQIVSSTMVTTETNFADIVTSTTLTEYMGFLGIS